MQLKGVITDYHPLNRSHSVDFRYILAGVNQFFTNFAIVSLLLD